METGRCWLIGRSGVPGANREVVRKELGLVLFASVPGLRGVQIFWARFACNSGVFRAGDVRAQGPERARNRVWLPVLMLGQAPVAGRAF
jgi:hypothetical protein